MFILCAQYEAMHAYLTCLIQQSLFVQIVVITYILFCYNQKAYQTDEID